MEEKRERKKKPEIKYDILYDGNVIVAEVDGKHFINWRTQIESRKKGGFGIAQLGAEGETERKDEWMGVVWEPETGLMSRSVWDEKRRKEIIENMKNTISEATGSSKDSIEITNVSGMVALTSPIPSTKKRCPYCNSEIPVYSKFCLICGKELK
jgi:hypothetical protein